MRRSTPTSLGALALLGCLSCTTPELATRDDDAALYAELNERRYTPMVVVPAPEDHTMQPGETGLAALAGRDVSIKDALLTLFQDSDLNILVEDDVNGLATFDIKDTTTERAFSALLRHLDLSYRVEGDFLLVGDTERRLFNLDLLNLAVTSGAASDADIWEQILADLQLLTGDEDTLIVSPRSGTVEVEAAPSTVAKVDGYLANMFERATNQVSLETRILEVRLSDEFRLGVDWTILDEWVSNDLVGLLEGGGIGAQSAAAGGDVFNLGFLNEGRFSLFIDALESQGQVRMLSNPRVATMNNVPANIRIVEQIPVTEREVIDTEAGSRTEYDIRFVDAGIAVEIVPQIGESGNITVWVHPTITEQVGTVTTPDGLQTEPILATRETSTVIRVLDGEAIVIGGLRSVRKVETLLETPLLSDIPLLGYLFRSTVQQMQEVELVIVVVPRVLDNEWRAEELRRSLGHLRALRRPFIQTTIDIEQRPETYGRSILQGELHDQPPATSRAMAFHDPVAPTPGAVATITRAGLASAIYEQAVDAAVGGRLEQAAGMFGEVMALAPEDVDARIYSALVEIARDDLDAAGRQLDRALRLTPDDPVALSLRGIVSLRRGAPDTALGDLEQAHVLAPTAITACNLAAALIVTGDLARAGRVLDGDVSDAGYPELHLNRAYVHLAAGEIEPGSDALRQALRAGAHAGSERVMALKRMLAELRGES